MRSRNPLPSALLGAALAAAATACLAAPPDESPPQGSPAPPAVAARPGAPPATRALQAPATGHVRVAFLISEGSNVIDMAGPWEVFQDVHVHERGPDHDAMMPFRLYTVAASREPVRLTGGLHVIPDYTLADAPQPDVVVIPAMRASPEVHAWLRRVAPEADLVMSVCTGAFQLARTGLLDGLPATTHHDYWDAFAREFPRVELVRDTRWVESNDRLATAGGLTSGIDLALRVVERYFGPQVAQATAAYMEHGR
jgi:transcriptional regulator GlxA family with amidase domain